MPALDAIIHGATGRSEKARALYEETARLSPNGPYLYFNRADLLSSLNQQAAAARDLLRFIKLHGFASLDGHTDGEALRQI